MTHKNHNAVAHNARSLARNDAERATRNANRDANRSTKNRNTDHNAHGAVNSSADRKTHNNYSVPRLETATSELNEKGNVNKMS